MIEICFENRSDFLDFDYFSYSCRLLRVLPDSCPAGPVLTGLFSARPWSLVIVRFVVNKSGLLDLPDLPRGTRGKLVDSFGSILCVRKTKELHEEWRKDHI